MRTFFSFLILVLATTITAPLARAVPCVLLTQANQLITFDSANPAGASVAVAVTGLTTFDLVGIDVRTTVQTVGAANPGVGTLWALGVDGVNTRIFVINPTTAVATPVGPVLVGITGPDGDNGWFFGHHPGTDRFRLMNAQKNYELNPNTITFAAQTDLVLFPNVNGSAFETASFGQASKIFFVEQLAGDALCTSATIENGTFTPVGATGLNFSLGAGLDIADNTTLLAVPDIALIPTLYSVNRSTGAATVIGAIGALPSMIRALTIQPATFPPTLAVTLKVKGKKKFETSSRVKKIRGTAKSLAGIKQVDFRVGKSKTKKAKGTTRWSARAKLKPGRNRVTFQAIGNNLIGSKPTRITIIRK